MTGELHARIRYTEPMVRKAVRVFVWRSLLRMGWAWVLAILLVLVSVVLAAWLGDGFGAGFGVAALLFAAVFVFALWRAHFRNAVGRFRKLDPPEADIVIGASDLMVRSSEGSSTLPWSRFVAVWELPGFLMLFLAPNQFMTVPTGGMAPEVLAGLRARLPKPG